MINKTTEEVAAKTFEAHKDDGTGLALGSKKKKVPFKEKARAAGQKLKAVGQKIKEDPTAISKALSGKKEGAEGAEGAQPAEEVDRRSFALEDDPGSHRELEDLYESHL